MNLGKYGDYYAPRPGSSSGAASGYGDYYEAVGDIGFELSLSAGNSGSVKGSDAAADEVTLGAFVNRWLGLKPPPPPPPPKVVPGAWAFNGARISTGIDVLAALFNANVAQSAKQYADPREFATFMQLGVKASALQFEDFARHVNSGPSGTNYLSQLILSYWARAITKAAVTPEMLHQQLTGWAQDVVRPGLRDAAQMLGDACLAIAFSRSIPSVSKDVRFLTSYMTSLSLWNWKDPFAVDLSEDARLAWLRAGIWSVEDGSMMTMNDLVAQSKNLANAVRVLSPAKLPTAAVPHVAVRQILRNQIKATTGVDAPQLVDPRTWTSMVMPKLSAVAVSNVMPASAKAKAAPQLVVDVRALLAMKEAALSPGYDTQLPQPTEPAAPERSPYVIPAVIAGVLLVGAGAYLYTQKANKER